MSDVGPVDRSAECQRVLQRRALDHATFRSPHKSVEQRRKPGAHQPILNWHRGDLGICQRLWNEHDAQGQAGDDIVDDPPIVVSWQPSDNGYFLDQILSRDPRRRTSALFQQIERAVPCHIRVEGLLDSINGLHDR